MTTPVDPAAAGRSYRLALDRPGTLRDPTRLPIDVIIDNLSETGALLRGEAALPVGTLVSLGVPGAGLRLARVVRAQPGAMAVEFMVPFEAAAVARARNAETLVSVAFPQMSVGQAGVPPQSFETRVAAATGSEGGSIDPRLVPVAGQAPIPVAGGGAGLFWLIGLAIAVALVILLIA